MIVECLSTEHLVAAALRDAQRAATRFVEMLDEANVLALDMRGRANRACRFCAANKWCPADRDVEALPKLMHYEPWVIEEGVRA